MTNDAPIKTLRETNEVINTIIARLQELNEFNLSLIRQMESRDITGSTPHPERLYLSPRELSVLKLVGRGLNNREIARELGLKESYIRGIVSRIYDKLEINDRGGLVLYAIRTGIAALNEATQN